MHRKLLILFALIAATAWAAPRNSTLSEQKLDRSAFRHAPRHIVNLDEDSLHQFNVIEMDAQSVFQYRKLRDVGRCSC